MRARCCVFSLPCPHPPLKCIHTSSLCVCERSVSEETGVFAKINPCIFSFTNVFVAPYLHFKFYVKLIHHEVLPGVYLYTPSPRRIQYTHIYLVQMDIDEDFHTPILRFCVFSFTSQRTLGHKSSLPFCHRFGTTLPFQFRQRLTKLSHCLQLAAAPPQKR